MRFTFTVNVEVARTEGPFASRESIAEEIQDALESADPGQYEGSNGGTYETVDWSVDEQLQPSPAEQQKARRLRAARQAAAR